MPAMRASSSDRRSSMAGAEVFRPRLGHVAGVGVQQVGRPGAQKTGGGVERAVLLLRRRQGQHARRLAGAAAQRQQAGFEIGGLAVDVCSGCSSFHSGVVPSRCNLAGSGRSAR